MIATIMIVTTMAIATIVTDVRYKVEIQNGAGIFWPHAFCELRPWQHPGACFDSKRIE
jgi:hypothetical protein